MRGIPAVGDSHRELEAACLAGAQPILVCTGKGRQTLQRGLDIPGVPVFDDLAAVADALLAGTLATAG